LVRIQLLVFVLKFSHSKPSNMTCFIRIFRVLHTVQSSVFKVLCIGRKVRFLDADAEGGI
jgi:hypothetical protein